MFYKLVFFGCILAAVNPNADGSPVLNLTDEAKREEHRDFVRRNLIATRNYCGFQHNDDRFSTANITELDEFPWLVQILVDVDIDMNLWSEYDYKSRCHGTLISNRYILTTFTCGRYAVRVRLGQYTLDEEVTCNQADPLFPECTEPTIQIDIENIYLHTNRHLDIYGDNFALLRLAKNIQYSDYVRPICLPINDTNSILIPEVLVLSGWGATENGTVIKKKLTYSPANFGVCYDANHILQTLYEDDDEWTCLTPHASNTELACIGDRGAPLIYSTRRYQWFLYGVFEEIFQDMYNTTCVNHHPILGKRLTEDTLDWILDNIEP